MFRLIKLAIYGLLGYAIYEFIRGLTEDSGRPGETGRGQGGSRELNRALDGGQTRANMTGPARGERVVTNDSSGASESHVVGRGVVSQ